MIIKYQKEKYISCILFYLYLISSLRFDISQSANFSLRVHQLPIWPSQVCIISLETSKVHILGCDGILKPRNLMPHGAREFFCQVRGGGWWVWVRMGRWWEGIVRTCWRWLPSNSFWKSNQGFAGREKTGEEKEEWKALDKFHNRSFLLWRSE